MSKLFLLGGGESQVHHPRTYWRFIDTATVNRDRRIVIVVAVQHNTDRAEREAYWRQPFELFEVVRKEQLHVIFASLDDPLTAQRLEALVPTGVFVGGALSPACHEALCTDRSWVSYVRERNLPYAGYSAGATMLSEKAIVGGRMLRLLHSNCEIVASQCDEGLTVVEVREGLGLVPFAVEAHATQWGSLCRLIHLVGEGIVASGWAIDEGCMLEIEGDELRVFGGNNAYRVRRLGECSTRVDVFRAGTVRRRSDW